MISIGCSSGSSSGAKYSVIGMIAPVIAAVAVAAVVAVVAAAAEVVMAMAIDVVSSATVTAVSSVLVAPVSAAAVVLTQCGGGSMIHISGSSSSGSDSGVISIGCSSVCSSSGADEDPIITCNKVPRALSQRCESFFPGL